MKAKLKSTESQEQQALFEWAETMEYKYPELKLMYHIPNGGLRNKTVAAKLKLEGVKSGVPDIFLPVAKLNFHGLYIEIKAEKGKLSENQKKWHEKLRNQGYRAITCWGWEEAKTMIESYLKWI